jgi:hypothetical protein
MSDPALEPITNEQIREKWLELAPIIDHLMEVSGTTPPDVPAGTAMAGDDDAIAPYRISHAIRHCLNVSADHLHAVKQLVHEDQILHVSAPATLARAVIENASTAIWLLHPTKRDDRLTRCFRWYSRDIRDKHGVHREGRAAHLLSRTLEGELDELRAVAAARGLDPKVCAGGYKFTTAVQEADLVVKMSLSLTYGMCSGFSHGRPWASLSMLDREKVPSSVAGVSTLRLTNDDWKALFPVLAGVFTVQEAMRLDQQRRKPWRPMV